MNTTTNFYADKYRFLKAFIAGSCYPIMLFPFTVFGQMHRLHPTDMSNPNDIIRPLIIENVPLVVPFYFGLWNALFLWLNGRTPTHNSSRNVRYFFGGLVLGFAFTTYGLVVHAIPTELFGIPAERQFMGPIVAALLMGILYRFLQQPLNVVMGLEPPIGEVSRAADGEKLASWMLKVVSMAVLFVGIPLVAMLIWVSFFPWQYAG